MFSALPRRCVARETCWSEIKRNISKSTTVTHCDSLTSNKHKDNLRNVSNTGSRKLLQLKKYHRLLSTLNSASLPLPTLDTAVSEEEVNQFMAVFSDIVNDLTDAGQKIDVSDATHWLSKVLQYNVPIGNKNRGLALVLAYKMMAKPLDLTPENIRLAMILGWCVEMLQASFKVADDIMDGSETRTGQPCWYKKEDVGLSAINDGLMLQAGIFAILRKYFHDKPYYINLLDSFHNTSLKTTMGQCMDMRTSKLNKPNLELFTMDRYNSIAKYKTAYYSFHLPIALALHLAGNKDPEMHRQSKTILLRMGQFFQVQDDFMDCFGDPLVTGKIGSDIQEGKCSWLAVVALQRTSPKQRKLMEKCYGSSNPQDVAAIKDLYEELGLPSTYAVYEEDSYKMIKTLIQQISRGLSHKLFFLILETVYRRDVKSN